MSKITFKRPSYELKQLSQEEGAISADMLVLAGKLNSDGEIENNAPFCHSVSATVLLIANTDVQLALSCYNKRYKRLLFICKAGAATASYDYILRMNGSGQGVRPLTDHSGNNLLAEDAVATVNPSYRTVENIPYGENLEYILTFDNNHAADNISMYAELLFYDPVR